MMIRRYGQRIEIFVNNISKGKSKAFIRRNKNYFPGQVGMYEWNYAGLPGVDIDYGAEQVTVVSGSGTFLVDNPRKTFFCDVHILNKADLTKL